MGDDSAYWRWRDEFMMHPGGRAVGGEPVSSAPRRVARLLDYIDHSLG